MDTSDDKEIIDILFDAYYLANHTPGLASGVRVGTLYAFRSTRAGFSQVNPLGPEPRDYVEFAREDVARGNPAGFINSLSNSKRAVHLAVQAFLQLHCLTRMASKMNFPQLLELFDQLEAFPTRLVASLNKRRNIVEHEYSAVSEEEARDFLDVAELFVTLCYRYFGGAVIGVYVGKVGDDSCYEYRINPAEYSLVISRVHAPEYVQSTAGRIHFNIGRGSRKDVVEQIPLEKGTRAEWLSPMNLLVFCTRQTAFRLGRIGRPGEIVPSESEFEITNTRDEHGRRETKLTETIFAPV